MCFRVLITAIINNRQTPDSHQLCRPCRSSAPRSSLLLLPPGQLTMCPWMVHLLRHRHASYPLLFTPLALQLCCHLSVAPLPQGPGPQSGHPANDSHGECELKTSWSSVKKKEWEWEREAEIKNGTGQLWWFYKRQGRRTHEHVHKMTIFRSSGARAKST